ncbi:carboxypeptidase A1-like [Artemia franciscana]|uniref:carboxypeptidase A1-like n=1 Tax=Artemia franciscana TaxID=6661 RepID=UPI0032D9D652
MKLLGLVFLFLAAVSAVPAKTGVKSYEGYKVFRALPSEEYQLAELLKLQDVQSYDFWSEISKHQPVDIMATPESISELEAFFKSHNIGYTTFMEDVEKKIQDSAVKSNVKSEIGSPRYSLNWDDYYRLDVIYEFFYSLAADFPNLIEVQTIGTSYEGRDIIMAKVSSGGGGTKPAMFVDGTFHAREWISPATLTFAVRELVENYAAHPELVDNIDWFFVPVVNPDGYEYTFTNDRLWRKTRAPTQGTCTGTDPNRNWDFHWSGKETQILTKEKELKIQDSAVKSNVKSEIGSPRYSLNWDDYYRLDVIYEFFYSLAADFPNLIEVQTIGTSYEGRDIIMAKVSSGGGGTKPAMFVDGTFHAREWISPATLTFAVRELVENYAAHPELVDNIDWFFVPVVNPDGYEYTFTNDRLWRKTRAPTQGTCTGTDPNRNWDFHWSEPGASDNTCSQTYHGDSPFSEVETAALRDVMLANLGQLKMYVSLHSYSQLFLLPWGYTTDLPDNYADQLSAANRAIAALTAVSGTQYEAGTSSNILYISSGSSRDWAHGVGFIPYSYTVELPDTGSSGFLLPPSEIIPTGTETWEAFKVLAEIVAGLA